MGNRRFASFMQKANNGSISCGKVRYKTEQAAEAALRSTRQKAGGRATVVRWYACSRCEGYHLTSQPAR